VPKSAGGNAKHLGAIQAERDLARLERWLERAIVASSIAEVIDDTRAQNAAYVNHMTHEGVVLLF
jgi:hypothetical protein